MHFSKKKKRKKDLGSSKSKTASEFVNKRVYDTNVNYIHSKFEKLERNYLKQFDMVVCAVDRIQTRKNVNEKFNSCFEIIADENGVNQKVSSPVIDVGTDGLEGHVNVINFLRSACLECNLQMFPKNKYFDHKEMPFVSHHQLKTKFDCVGYTLKYIFPDKKRREERGLFLNKKEDNSFDVDNPSHIEWVWKVSTEFALKNQISLSFQDVKSICSEFSLVIPSLASTSSIIGSIGSHEALKLFIGIYIGANYTRWNGKRGLYTSKVFLERKLNCKICTNIQFSLKMNINTTLQEFNDYLLSEENIKAIGFRYKEDLLYINAPKLLEKQYIPNFQKTLYSLTNDISPKISVYTFPSDCQIEVNIFFEETLFWSPNNHQYFEKIVKKRIFNFLCSVKLSPHLKLKIPKVIFYLIIQFLTVNTKWVESLKDGKNGTTPWF